MTQGSPKTPFRRIRQSLISGVTGLCAVVLMIGAGCEGSGGHHQSSPTSTVTSSTTVNPPGSSTMPTGGGGSSAGPTGLRWYVGIPVLLQLLRADPTLTTHVFDNPQTFVAITSPGQISEVPKGWSVTPVETFFDGTALQTAIQSGHIPIGVKGVVLDDEKGNKNLTPVAEQQNPIPLERQAASAARAHGLLFLDVGQAPAGVGPLARFHAARYANVVDLQVQLAEDDPAKFESEVQRGVKAFHQVNPHVTVLIGITARLRGGEAATPDQMVQAVDATRAVAGGYWLNCTPCDSSDLGAAQQFLARLVSTSSTSTRGT